MKKRLYEFAGYSLITGALWVAVLYPLLWRQVIAILERLVSSDGQITASGESTLWHLYGYGIAFALVMGVMSLYLSRHERYQRLWPLLARDPLRNMEPIRPGLIAAVVLPVLVGIAMQVIEFYTVDRHSRFMRIYYYERGILETATMFAMLIGSIYLSKALRAWKRKGPISKQDRPAVIFLALFALGMFMWAGEEISWGQHIFGWKTPALFAGNAQNETSLHNYFNPYLRVALRTMAASPLAALLGIAIELGPKPSRVARLILPHASLLPLLLVHSITASLKYRDMPEQIELLISLICLLYAIRLWQVFRPASKKQNAALAADGQSRVS